VQGIGLLALMLTVALLITPSMTHQMAYRGEDRKGALRIASTCAGLAMVPMILGLGATTFVVFESLFNRNIGVIAGITFAIVAFFFLYALGLVLRIGHKGQMPPSEKQTLLKTKIEQLLTLAAEDMDGQNFKLPIGERFWPLVAEERREIERLFRNEELRRLLTEGEGRDDDADLRVVDAAYWRKGCSSLGPPGVQCPRRGSAHVNAFTDRRAMLRGLGALTAGAAAVAAMPAVATAETPDPVFARIEALNAATARIDEIR
jgi:Family of unknown function (DUF6328)